MSSNISPRQRILIIVLMVLGIVFTAFFGWRALHALRRFHGHRPPPPGQVETDVELIRDWMTIPFIAHTYGLPPEALFKAVDIAEKENRKKSLDEINRQYFPEQEDFVITRIQQAILAFQQHAPLPPIPDPPPGAPVLPTP